MNISKKLMLGTVAVFGLGLSACATIIEGSSQKVDFLVEGASKAYCVAFNEDYKYYFIAPGETDIERSRKDLKVDCKADRGRRTSFLLKRQFDKDMAQSNMSTALLGLAVDTANGAIHDFPSVVTIQFAQPQPFMKEPMVEEAIYQAPEEVWEDSFGSDIEYRLIKSAPDFVGEGIDSAYDKELTHHYGGSHSHADLMHEEEEKMKGIMDHFDHHGQEIKHNHDANGKVIGNVQMAPVTE